jgi:hypothetical protein
MLKKYVPRPKTVEEKFEEKREKDIVELLDWFKKNHKKLDNILWGLQE